MSFKTHFNKLRLLNASPALMFMALCFFVMCCFLFSTQSHLLGVKKFNYPSQGQQIQFFVLHAPQTALQGINKDPELWPLFENETENAGKKEGAKLFAQAIDRKELPGTIYLNGANLPPLTCFHEVNLHKRFVALSVFRI